MPTMRDFINAVLTEAYDYDLHQAWHQAWVRYKEEPTEANGREFVRLRGLVSAMQAQERAAEPEPMPEPAEGYRGEHEAPDPSNGAPLHDLSGIYPDDFYGPNGLSHYGGDDPGSYGIVAALRGRPNAPVMVYRAVPKGSAAKRINPGDWVTLSRSYAKEHGRDNLRNDYRILSKTVFARDLFTDGNSIQEWGYVPQPRQRRSASSMLSN